MFKATDLSSRLIINLADGRRIGPVKDMIMNDAGRVEAIVLRGRKRLMGVLRDKDIVVPWPQVKKIGVDAVLVEIEGL
ncbi:PRC-barrel domain-containing protein [Desulforudis sp. 1088]|uniref:PRC-barrel domain-containing protein n=1 Tax=unclassified Candidatus Desulforudis TaxID=2635950 RepID=UPI003CE44C53